MNIQVIITSDERTKLNEFTTVINHLEELRPKLGVTSLQMLAQLSNITNLNVNHSNPCLADSDTCAISINDLADDLLVDTEEELKTKLDNK